MVWMSCASWVRPHSFCLIWLCFLVFTAGTATSPLERDYLYIWNVGQGSWSTLITTSRCYHFDMGGEFFVRHPALKTCRSKENRLYLSHLDADHISFISRFQREVRILCLDKIGRPSPPPPASSQRLTPSGQRLRARQEKLRLKRQRLVDSLPSCPASNLRVLNIMFHKTNSLLKTANDRSQVFTLDQKWLFAGDSTKKAEKFWAQSAPSDLKFLVVGHHGSRTSTSPELLQRWPRLAVAIVSARKRKYGHPHIEVVELFRQNKIPLLLTETWGHLVFEL